MPPILSKEIKLLTLSLLLRTMPKNEQSLIMQHFAPDVVKHLEQIEASTGSDVEKLDWTPFYQTWPELQKILNDCKEEIKAQRIVQFAEEQRPRLKDYILMKLGKQRKGAPVFLSPEVTKTVDQYMANLGRL